MRNSSPAVAVDCSIDKANSTAGGSADEGSQGNEQASGAQLSPCWHSSANTAGLFSSRIADGQASSKALLSAAASPTGSCASCSTAPPSSVCCCRYKASPVPPCKENTVRPNCFLEVSEVICEMRRLCCDDDCNSMQFPHLGIQLAARLRLQSNMVECVIQALTAEQHHVSRGQNSNL